MMNKYLLLCIFSIVFFSCKKKTETIDDMKIELPDTKGYELITSGKWHFAGNIINPPLAGISDVYSTYSACYKDDTSYFKPDSVLTIDAGAIKCNINDSQSNNYSWWISSDTLLFMNGFPYKIKQLNNNLLILNFTQTFGSTVHTYTATYKNYK